MRKITFLAVLMIFTLSSTIAFAGKSNLKSSSDNATTKTENKLTAAEVTRLTDRVEAIRKMDKSELTVTEKRELRKELKGIKENVRRGGEVLYISGGTILLIILILLLI